MTELELVVALDKDRNELRAALREALDGWARAAVTGTGRTVFEDPNPYESMARLRRLLTGDSHPYNLRQERDGLQAALILAMDNIHSLKEEISRYKEDIDRLKKFSASKDVVKKKRGHKR